MAKKTEDVITIQPPKFHTVSLLLEGISPYMQLNFSEKGRREMEERQRAGSTARSKKVRQARDFDEDFVQAQHISSDGWNGIPAAAFRNASIDVCRMVGFKMTHARMSIFIEADGFDRIDGTPLVRLNAPPPEKTVMPVRNATGVADLRARPMWREWSVTLRVRFDMDQFTVSDVVNLLHRAGTQVGIGEGRPFSKQSNGLGFGMFTVKSIAE